MSDDAFFDVFSEFLVEIRSRQLSTDRRDRVLTFVRQDLCKILESSIARNVRYRR